MSLSKEKLWTKNFLIVFGVNFFLFLCFYLLMVVIPTYAKEEFHASTGIAGFASSVFVLGALVGRLVGGAVIERIGRRKLLMYGLAAFLLFTFLYFFAASLVSLFAVRFLHGVAFAFASTATGTIAASMIPESRRGEGIGYYGVSVIIATAIGPFIGLMISEHASAYANFAVCASLALVTLLSALWLKVPVLAISHEQAKEMKGYKHPAVIEPRALRIAVISLMMAFGYSSVLSYLTFYAEELNLVEAAGFFFIVYAIFVIISRPFTGRLFDRRGPHIVVYPAIILYTIGMIALSQVHSGAMLLLASVFIGLGYGTMQSSSQALAIQMSPPHRIALATSTFYIFVDVGIGIGPFALGFIEPLIGFRGMYLTMAGLLAVSIGLYYWMIGRNGSGSLADTHSAAS